MRFRLMDAISFIKRDEISGLWRTDLKDGSEKQLTKGVDVLRLFRLTANGLFIRHTMNE